MPSSFKEVLGFSFIVTVWGLNYPVSLLGMNYAPSLWLAFFRAFSAFLSFSAVLILFKVRVKLKPRQILIGAMLGIPGSFVFFGFWLLGMQTVSPGIASVLVTAYPLWMLFMSVPVLGEHPSKGKTIAALFGFVGVALASNVIFDHTNNSLIADVELLLAGLGFGLMTITVKRFFTGNEMLKANQLQLGASLLPLFAWSILTQPFSTIHWSSYLVGSILWLGILGTAVAFSLWFILLSRYNASSMGVYMFMIIVVALVASFFIYGERVNALQLLGILIIIISIYRVNRSDKKAESLKTSSISD